MFKKFLVIMFAVEMLLGLFAWSAMADFEQGDVGLMILKGEYTEINEIGYVVPTVLKAQ